MSHLVKYIGMKWDKLGGDCKTSFNCLTYFIMIQKEVFKRDVNFESLKVMSEGETLKIVQLKTFEECKNGDILIFRADGTREAHVATVIKEGSLTGALHCSEGVGSLLLTTYNLSVFNHVKYYGVRDA